MATAMRLETKNLDSPDETRRFEKGRAEFVTLGGGTVWRSVLDPGWRWSEHNKAAAGTDSCEQVHVGYIVSGGMKVVMDEGAEAELGPGDVMLIQPGHDAWTVGDEPCVVLDFSGMEGYIKAK